MESKYELRPMWDEILKIYDAIKDICERNNLRYFVYGGTLIGAVRHHGFIPWDDDFDLMMPRPDYDKFILLAQKMLPYHLKWHSVETDPEHGLRFGKVCLEDEEAIAKVAESTSLSLPQGIYVDVFPIDGLPPTGFGRFLWCVKRALIRRAVDCDMLFFKLMFLMGNNRQKNRIRFQNWLKVIPFETAKRVGTPSPYEAAATPQRWWFKREWFDSFLEVVFEDRKVRIPCGAHDLLLGVYGDYMKLPSVEQRKPSHQVVG